MTPQVRWWANLLLAAAPVLLLLFISGARLYLANKFVFCAEGPNRCHSIAENATRILLLDNPPSPAEIAAKKTEQKWKDKTSDAAAAEAKAKVEQVGRDEQIYSGRLNWVFMMFFWVFTSLAAIVLGAWWIWRPVVPLPGPGEKQNVRRLRWRMLALSLAGWSALWYFLSGLPQYLMPVLRFIIPDTLESDVHGVQAVIQRVNGLGLATAVFVGITIWIINWDVLHNVSLIAATASTEGFVTSPPSAAEPTVRALDVVRQGMNRLQTMLYAGTLMLVVGVLLERSVFQWAMAFLPQEEHAVKTAQSFFASLLTADGAFYTLALGAVYLPSAVILKKTGENFKGLPVDRAEKEKELQTMGLNFSFTESLPKLLAILAPLLAGPIGELFNRLGK